MSETKLVSYKDVNAYALLALNFHVYKILNHLIYR